MGAGNLLKTTDRTFANNTDVDENPTAGNKAHDILGGAARLYYVAGVNNDSAVAYLDIFDHAAPVQGTTEPDFRFRIASGSGTRSNFMYPFGSKAGSIAGYKFATALSYAGVTAAGGATGATNLDAFFEAEKV